MTVPRRAGKSERAPRLPELTVVEIDEAADVDLAVRHYVQMALAQIGVPVTLSRSAA